MDNTAVHSCDVEKFDTRSPSRLAMQLRPRSQKSANSMMHERSHDNVMIMLMLVLHRHLHSGVSFTSNA